MRRKCSASAGLRCWTRGAQGGADRTEARSGILRLTVTASKRGWEPLRSISEARPDPGAQAPTRRRDPCPRRPPGRQRLHVRIEEVAPRRERGMEAREPADAEQRGPGEREDASEKRGADDLGDDEYLQAQQGVPARDQPEGEQLERNENRGGNEKGDERCVGRKASDARLAPADSGQLADPRHAGLHGVPYPLLEKDPQRRQERERAAHHGGKNVLGVSPHFHVPAPAKRPPHPAFAPRIARQRRSGVAGMSKCVTPAWRSASDTAFMSAGSEPLTPASPTPLAPSGFVAVGTGCSRIARPFTRPARGIG